MNAAAQLILSYYQVKDSNSQASDYLRRLDTITSICLQRFQEHLENDDNQIVILFYVMVRLDEHVLALDSIGAQEAANKLSGAYAKVDADLRAVITKLTNVNVTIDHSIDYEFLEQFDEVVAEVYYFDQYRKRHR